MAHLKVLLATVLLVVGGYAEAQWEMVAYTAEGNKDSFVVNVYVPSIEKYVGADGVKGTKAMLQYRYTNGPAVITKLVSVKASDCDRGYGTLYQLHIERNIVVGTVAFVKNGDAIADSIAGYLCSR